MLSLVIAACTAYQCLYAHNVFIGQSLSKLGDTKHNTVLLFHVEQLLLIDIIWRHKLHPNPCIPLVNLYPAHVWHACPLQLYTPY